MLNKSGMEKKRMFDRSNMDNWEYAGRMACNNNMLNSQGSL
jgi:hypothetical protein